MLSDVYAMNLCFILYRSCCAWFYLVLGSGVNITGSNEASSGVVDGQPCFAVQHDGVPGSEAV